MTLLPWKTIQQIARSIGIPRRPHPPLPYQRVLKAAQSRVPITAITYRENENIARRTIAGAEKRVDKLTRTSPAVVSEVAAESWRFSVPEKDAEIRANVLKRILRDTDESKLLTDQEVEV